ncbi:response regulator transcription factor [Paludibaculum fermentans]|uniref:Response regulator transcription factor n=1 Tax=Paludibaculum fermentans TaxID=1473598 RepID=A0A7S7NLA4_PALFE|nr:response regulator transcription factor [Paludibaculum fermentans]QOY85730.1 response regulator transcription factor [Paludibaculum fermentans]
MSWPFNPPLLVVSEDRVLRGELARVLTKQSWDVLCFADWEHATTGLPQAAGGILVTDHSWDQAVEVAKQLDPPALVVAVCDGPHHIKEAKEAGVYDTIVRPFEAMEPAWTVACAWHFASCQAEARSQCDAA